MTPLKSSARYGFAQYSNRMEALLKSRVLRLSKRCPWLGDRSLATPRNSRNGSIHVINTSPVYYSTLTYTALGFGDFQPIGFGRLLIAIETSLGAVMLTLLVFILGRRAAR